MAAFTRRSARTAWTLARRRWAPIDHRLLEQLAEVMPPLGHAVPLAGAKPPLRARSPGFLIAAAWDALADTLPRTAAAATVSGGPLFAATEPTPATELRPWLAEASGGLDGGASFALRVQLGDALEPEPKGVLQISSISDPSLVVDAADLFSMPAALLARFGEQAERDLLLALRRGSRAWAPIGALLTSASPTPWRSTTTCWPTCWPTGPTGWAAPGSPFSGPASC